MKNIGILGIGAIGSLLTKYLVKNRTNNYFYFNRTKKDRIKIEFQSNLDDIPIEISCPKQHKLDWLIVCLKEYHFHDAISTLNELIEHNTKVAIFQNGINLADRYKQFSNPSNLLETIIDCPIQKISPDEFTQIRIPKIILPDNENANKFTSLFKAPEIEFTKSNKFHKLQWIKLIESSSIGSIQAINEMPCSVFQNPEKLDEFKELVTEGIEVARSEGIKISRDLKSKLLSKLKNYPVTKGSSMLSDKLSGNKLELNAKIGVIVKIAKRNKVSVPKSNSIFKSLVN
jgi:2-dehydropantoate 2-reductase